MPKGFQILSPVYRDMTPAEIRKGQNVESGSSASTEGVASGTVFAFADSSADEVEGILEVASAPGFKFAITGIDNIGKVDLTAFDLTQDEIEQRTSQVTSNQYSMGQLLAGDYNPSGRRRRDETSTDDDDYYEEPPQDIADEILTESPEVFSVLNLGNDQLLIFPGIDRQEFLNRTADFFIGYIPDEVTTVEHNSTAPWTTTRPLNFTTSSSQIGGYVPPQINGTNTQANPLAAGSAGFGLLIAAGVVAAGTVIAAIVSPQFRTSLSNGAMRVVNFFDPRNWRRSARTSPQEEIVFTEVITTDEARRAQAANPLADELDNAVIANTVFAKKDGDENESEADEEVKYYLASDEFFEGKESEEGKLRAPSPSASLRGDVVRAAEVDSEITRS